jgi:predicted phosphodiesterase
MRYAIVSDIHANLHAWQAALADIRRIGADQILCLGDIIGYGPSPMQVIDSVYDSVTHTTLGNHDAAICGFYDPAYFNDHARRTVEWTHNQLDRQAIQFLEKLPLKLRAKTFCCVHGDLSAPRQFNYIIDPIDAIPTWKHDPSPLVFVGHSHTPAIFVTNRSGHACRIPPQDFSIAPEKRYIVNVGSIGLPRDNDPRATYCLLDTKERTIRWRRIHFDVTGYHRALQAAGLEPAT